uniref:receptor-type tyrosine-protein phosphatase delta-like isoform X2 n=1 Tax=Myxine glutinosa TaxID=7769 RepID=UPI00358DE534
MMPLLIHRLGFLPSSIILSLLYPTASVFGEFPPEFTQLPEDQTGVSGGVASFVCIAKGDPRPHITWTKKGQKVSSQRFEVIQFSEGLGSVLRIQPLRTPSDDGIYQCTISNGLGEVSATSTLTVQPGDSLPRGFPRMEKGPELRVVERAHTAILLCAASGQPEPEISWYKDFLPVDTNRRDGRIRLLLAGALQIEHSNESDQGKYECVATNSLGTLYSAPANLIVKVRTTPPRFTVLPSSQEVMPGGGVNLTCVAIGNPMPFVKWLEGERELTSTDDPPVSRSVLELTGIKSSANYTCLAMSSLGIIEAVAQVNVKALPKPPSTPVVTETTATSVTLTWASGNSEPVSYYAIQYRVVTQHGTYQDIDGITTTRYTVGGLGPFTLYEFRVIGVNSIGRGQPSPIVDTRTAEQAPSSPPQRVEVQMLSSSTMAITWDDPQEPNGQVKGYRVFYTSNTDLPVSTWNMHNIEGSRFASVDGLIPKALYMVRVLAFTSVGDGPLSSPVNIKASMRVPSQPMNFKAQAEPDRTVLLSWTPPRFNQKIIGYNLRFQTKEDTEEQLSIEPTMTHIIENLRPNTQYMFRLAARSEHGLGAFTPPVIVTTMQSPPTASPHDISCQPDGSMGLRVSWEPPPEATAGGEIMAYGLRYRTVGGSWQGPLLLPPSPRVYILRNLNKWTRYEVALQAHTAVGPGPESEPIAAQTEEDVPSGPPRQVQVQEINSTAIRVSWRSPPASQHHGQIRGYQIHWVHLEGSEPREPPRLQDLMLSEEQLERDKSTEYEVVVSGLRPETTYSVIVAAYTTKGDGAHSRSELVTTGPPVPSAPPLQVTLTKDTTAQLKWKPPSITHGTLLGYHLLYGRADGEQSPTSLDLPPSDLKRGISNLHQGATYTFQLTAKNPAGLGEKSEVTVKTPGAAPTGAPLGLVVTGLSSQEAELRWEPPTISRRNGHLTGYSVAYREIGEAGEAGETVANVENKPETHLLGLKPDTVYTARVWAKNIHGAGPDSGSIQFRTASADQGFAKNFHVKAVTKTSVLLTWEIPEGYLPISPFQIVCDNGLSVVVEGSATQKLITPLDPDTKYSFILMNRGSAARSLQQTVAARTAPNVLRSRPSFLTEVNEEGQAKITLPAPPPASLIVRAYYLVVLRLSRAGKFAKLPWSSPDEMELQKLFPDMRNKRSTGRSVFAAQEQARSEEELHKTVSGSDEIRRRPRSPMEWDGGQPYITARLDSLTKEFTLGDDHKYGGFHNRRLQPVFEYTFFVVADIGGSDTATFAATPYAERLSADSLRADNSQYDGEGLLWILGPVLAVLIIICVVIAILLCKRKRSDSQPVKTVFCSNKETPNRTPGSDPVQIRRVNFQTLGMMNHPPIPVEELDDHVERLVANDGLRFSQEYESIDPGQQFTWEHSNMDVNKAKNRYANVVAYDHSRVPLSIIEGIPGSDYINANYMDGYRRQNAYIATQGPLPETFADFWRMVWEQRSATIVTMTRLEERGRVKCDQYWPSRGVESYGQMQVSLLDTMELAAYSIRSFALCKVGSTEQRELKQFQFTSWPDHGVPEHPTPFLSFLRRVRQADPLDSGPMVVHCSAGVGRTGCFIVLDAMLERMRHENTVDVYGLVTCLRTQRNYTVQTEEQYAFVHEALREAVVCGCTEVPARALHTALQRLQQVAPGETATGMELEFKRLFNSKPQTSRFITANLPCNKFKNRLVNVLPYESTRVCLLPIRGVEGSDYINASFVDGYRQQKAYIATQGPLAETTEDFWRMLWEQNSTIVVMLTKLREMGREKCYQYWPAERSARYQYFVVDPVAEYNMPQYILREFKVTDARDGQSRTVRQFQFVDWPEQGTPRTGEGFIDFIGQVHKTKEQFGQEGPIAVHCSTGVGRTGVFVALSVVLERMRYEGMFDLFQTVKMIRTQRPALVQIEEQYQFCYRAALEYLGSFDHYAV